MTFADRIAAQAGFFPHKAAIIYEREQHSLTLTYSELFDRTTQAAQLLSRHWQLNKGDRITWLGLNHADMFVLLIAAARLGVVVVPLNWRLASDELAFILDECTPRVLFHDAEHAEVASELCAGRNLAAVDLDRWDTLDIPATSQPQAVHVNATDPCLIVFTSGTTGRPKGAVLPHAAIDCNALMSQHMYDLTPADVVLNILPLFHVGGLNIQPLPALMHGATLVLHKQFNPRNAIRALEQHQVTLVNSVPTILQAILAEPDWQTADITSLKSISIGSTDVPLELIKAVHAHEIPLVQVYGATETGPICIYQRVDQAFDSVGSIGRAGLACDIRLTDTDGNDVPLNTSGEIRVRGKNILSHYWNNEAATRASIVDGWFCTGDVAWLDENGDYWFADRLKHVIISGGENIYPAEIERVIRGVDGVAEVCVVGKADARWGEVPVAIMVRTPGTDTDDATVARACDDCLARFKRPRQFVWVQELPRNAMGKIQHARARELV